MINSQLAAKILKAETAYGKGLMSRSEFQEFVDKSATLLSKTSNLQGVKEQPVSTHWIEVRLANGEVKMGKVEVFTPSKVAITVCNSTDTTGLTRIH